MVVVVCDVRWVVVVFGEMSSREDDGMVGRREQRVCCELAPEK